MLRLVIVSLLISVVLALSGCSRMPSRGPSAAYVAAAATGARSDQMSYMVMNLDAPTVRALQQHTPPPVPNAFRQIAHKRKQSIVGPGDQLAIVIWEPTEEGLFSSASNKNVQINLTVDDKGVINFPYIGPLSVKGKSRKQVRAMITEGLAGKAVDPQVVVNLKPNGSHNVIVLGDIGKPGQYPVSEDGLSLLELLANAGGNRNPEYQTDIRVIRGNASFQQGLDELAGEPANNIWLQPADTIIVTHAPKSFTSFGAVMQRRSFEFTKAEMNLAEAMGQVGGLHDGAADAAGVFLFRFEPKERLYGLIEPDSKWASVDMVPIVYRMNLREPSAIFLARAFEVRDQDIIYVANASASEVNKFISILVSPITGVARTGMTMTGF